VSDLSWQEAKEKGLAGSDSCICLPSALDCLYKDVEFPTWFYSYYTDAYLYQARYGANAHRTKVVYQKLITLITGSTRLKQVRFIRAKSPDHTGQILAKARQGGFKIVIVVEKGHVVGLKPTLNGLWIMVGNGLPTNEALTGKQIYRFLYQNKPLKRNVNDSNIFLFPSVK